MKNDKKKTLKVHKFLVAHANLKILRKVRKNLRGRTTARPHILETLSWLTFSVLGNEKLWYFWSHLTLKYASNINSHSLNKYVMKKYKAHKYKRKVTRCRTNWGLKDPVQSCWPPFSPLKRPTFLPPPWVAADFPLIILRVRTKLVGLGWGGEVFPIMQPKNVQHTSQFGYLTNSHSRFPLRLVQNIYQIMTLL